MAQMRRVLGKTKSGAKVADALKELEVEGGLAGKWRVLYEVRVQYLVIQENCFEQLWAKSVAVVAVTMHSLLWQWLQSCVWCD